MKLLLAAPLAAVMAAANGQELKLPVGSDCIMQWTENPANEYIEYYEVTWAGPRPQGDTYRATVAQVTCSEVGININRPARYMASVVAANAAGKSKSSTPIHFRFVGEPGRPPTRPEGFIVLPVLE